MDRFALAARRFILKSEEEDGFIIDSRILHVHYAGSWRGFRLYEYYIDDGRCVEPRYPPIYIMVDKDCSVRWMTVDEAVEYQKYLWKGVERYSDNN